MNDKETEYINIKSGEVITSVNKPNRDHKKTIFIWSTLIILLFALLALIFVISINNDNNKQELTDDFKCTNDYRLMNRGFNYLAPDSVENLGIVVEEIRQMSGYERDQNCLYLISSHYIGLGDAIKSREYYNKFESIYKDELSVVSNGDLGDFTLSKEGLEERIIFLESLQEQSINNENAWGLNSDVTEGGN